jgi:hypothetical protein
VPTVGTTTVHFSLCGWRALNPGPTSHAFYCRPSAPDKGNFKFFTKPSSALNQQSLTVFDWQYVLMPTVGTRNGANMGLQNEHKEEPNNGFHLSLCRQSAQEQRSSKAN